VPGTILIPVHLQLDMLFEK